MERAIKKGRGFNKNGLLNSHKRFKAAWEKAGRPKKFLWDSRKADLRERLDKLKNRIRREKLEELEKAESR